MFAATNKKVVDASSQQIVWHYETLPSCTKKALDFLSAQQWLKKSPWYLAGGTALALQAGTRKSLDLDFFTEAKDFDEKKLIAHFLRTKEWTTDVEEKNTIYGTLYKTKVSFIAYPFFVPKQKPLWHGAIRVLNRTDIAVMKITAVSQRGRKRDFFDLYWCVKNIEPLEDTVRRLKKQYPSVAHDYHHILKALVYFADAESDPEPIIYFAASWKTVKRFFTKEIPIIAEKLIQ